MPNLARTPPQRVSPLPRSPNPAASATSPAAGLQASASQAPPPSVAPAQPTPQPEASSSTPTSTRSTRTRQSAASVSVPSVASPTRVFAPRNPGVMRTPPGGRRSDRAQMQAEEVVTGQTARVPEIEVQEASLSGIQPDTDMQNDTEGGAEGGDEERTTLASSTKRKREDDELFVSQQTDAGSSTSPVAYTATTSTTPILLGQSRTPGRASDPIEASTTPLAPPPISSTTTSTTPKPLSAKGTQAVPSTTPSHPPPVASASASASVSASTSTTIADPVTPRAQTRARRSTRTAAEAAEAASIINAPIDRLEEDASAQYGKRYAITLSTLEVASRAAALKWTRKDLEQCFPLISADHPNTINQLQKDTAHNLHALILKAGQEHLEDAQTGRALLMLDEAVREAKEHKAAGGGRRPDAWRPDLKPHAVTAAANLGIYDEAYGKLRAEYLGLHQDCSDRFASIKAKQAELEAFEGGVSDGVVELEKSIQAMSDFPTSNMKEWAETMLGKLEGDRAS